MRNSRNRNRNSNSYLAHYKVTCLEVTPPGGGKPFLWTTTKENQALEQLVLDMGADGSKVRVSFWDDQEGKPVWLDTLPDGKTVLLPV